VCGCHFLSIRNNGTKDKTKGNELQKKKHNEMIKSDVLDADENNAAE
jgi:hypothetical protein